MKSRERPTSVAVAMSVLLGLNCSASRSDEVPLLPTAVIDAYRAGKMTPLEALQFEVDVRAKDWRLPPGESVRGLFRNNQWSRFGAKADATYFLHLGRSQFGTDIVGSRTARLWFKTEYAKPHFLMGNVPYSAVLTELQLRCGPRSYQLISSAVYSEGGDLVQSTPESRPSESIAPDTIADKIYEVICRE